MAKKSPSGAKPVPTHTCKACNKSFPGTGKRGRPFNNCPKCRGGK